MGITFIEASVKNPPSKVEKVRFLVDSGATYSVLPHKTWTKLGLEPKRSVGVSLADGTLLERQVADCFMQIAGIEAATPIILGEPGDEALLGLVTLENMGLVLDPLKRTLQPIKVRL